MKTVFEKVIRRGGYDLGGLLQRIDEYHVEGKLTDGEREELMGMARGGVPGSGVDAAGEVQRLWAALRAMEARVAALEGGDGGQGGAADGVEVSEFVQPTGAHDAYYAGDVVGWQGKVLVCVAPEGVACVWSPEVMPAYWQEAEAAVTDDA